MYLCIHCRIQLLLKLISLEIYTILNKCYNLDGTLFLCLFTVFLYKYADIGATSCFPCQNRKVCIKQEKESNMGGGVRLVCPTRRPVGWEDPALALGLDKPVLHPHPCKILLMFTVCR